MRHLTRRNPAADQSLDDIFAQDFEFEDDPGASDFGSDFEDDPELASFPEDDVDEELTQAEIDLLLAGEDVITPEDVEATNRAAREAADIAARELAAREEAQRIAEQERRTREQAELDEIRRRGGATTPQEQAEAERLAAEAKKPVAKDATTTVANAQQSGTSSALAAIMGGLFVGAAVVVGMRGYREMKNRR